MGPPSPRTFPPLAGYEILELIGKGASSLVFKARRKDHDRPVALKVFAPENIPPGEARERFLREVRLVRESGHECLVPILDADPDHDPPYLALAYMPGGDLSRQAASKVPLPLAETVALGRRVAAALEHLHGLGIVHRDVKPGNILRDEAGRAYLGDLGLAKQEISQDLTRSGTLLGTAIYMAPEVIEGRRATPATDLFSLAVVLVELLCGELPVRRPDGTFLPERLAAPRIPAMLVARLRQCLRSEPEDRPVGVQVLRTVLEAIA